MEEVCNTGSKCLKPREGKKPRKLNPLSAYFALPAALVNNTLAEIYARFPTLTIQLQRTQIIVRPKSYILPYDESKNLVSVGLVNAEVAGGLATRIIGKNYLTDNLVSNPKYRCIATSDLHIALLVGSAILFEMLEKRWVRKVFSEFACHLPRRQETGRLLDELEFSHSKLS